jgi:hypothetical protein
MSTLEESIKNLCKEVIKINHNPLLLLDLKEIRASDLLGFHNLLIDKNFDELDVLLQTPGGDIDAAFRFTKLLRHSARKVNIIVPLYAKSAGTLMCLGADKLLLTYLSELGPLDTQIPEVQDGDSPEYHSALNGFKALEQVQQHTLETLDIATKLILSRSGLKISEAIHLATEFAGQTSGTLYTQLSPQKIGEYARALEIGEQYGIIILTRFMGWSKNKAEIVVKTLVKQYPSHGFVIDLDELKKLELPAEETSPELTKILCAIRELLLQTKNTIIDLIEPEQPMPAQAVVVRPATDSVEPQSTQPVTQVKTRPARKKVG